MKDFPYFCSAVCNYEDGNIELNLIFKSMLQTFKQQCGDENWRTYISKFPDDLK